MSNEPNPDPQMIDNERAYSYSEGNIVIHCGELKSFTLKQSLGWAKRNCTPETVQRLRSRAVVARLVEEVEKLQVLLGDVRIDLNSGYHISHRTTSDIDTYFSELNKS